MTSTWAPVTVPAFRASTTSGQAPSRVARLAGVGRLGLGEPGIERIAEAAELDDGAGVGRHLRRLDGLAERFET
jgi:hypothetical protein